LITRYAAAVKRLEVVAAGANPAPVTGTLKQRLRRISARAHSSISALGSFVKRICVPWLARGELAAERIFRDCWDQDRIEEET
jgi:hypothetical protein